MICNIPGYNVPKYTFSPTKPIAVLVIATGERGEALFNKYGYTAQAYAAKVDADFLLLKDTGNPDHRYLDKFFIGEVLKHYDRCLYIDADVEVKPDAPNLFNYTPQHLLGIFSESRYYESPDIGLGLDRVQSIGTTYNCPIPRPKEYLSTGIVIASKSHTKAFTPPCRFIPKHPTYEQDFIHFNIVRYNIPLQVYGPELQYINFTAIPDQDHGLLQKITKFHHWTEFGRSA